jgi:hypothetical protein
MAAKYQLIDQNVFFSLLAETSVNTPYGATANFVGARVNSGQPPYPDVNRSVDNMVGDGSERGRLRRGWMNPMQLPIGGLLNTETAARLATRCLGGTRTPGSEISGGSGVYDVITNMQTKAQGRLPKLTTWGYDLAGYKFIHPSLAVNQFEISFEGESDVNFSASLINTGLYRINDSVVNLQAQGFSADMANALANGGTQQVETATVVGTITLAGTVTAIVTAAGMTGTPVTVTVNVLLNDTASVVAGKIRTALAANANVSAWFYIGGTGTEVMLTAKAAAANDATMNIAIDNGTATGLTTAATSANTTAGAVAGLIVPPTPPTHHLMHPAATKVTFSDGTTRDFAADGDLISGACGLDNQIVVKQEPGDPFLLATNRKAGAYARDIHRGARVPSARLKINPGSDNLPFILAQNATDITSLTYLFRSEDPIGSTAYFYEFEWKCPLAEIETVQSDPDGDDAAVTMNFYPKTDPVTGGYWIQRIRTDLSTIQ